MMMQSILLYDGRLARNAFAFGRNFTWPNGQLPGNKPLCGFDGAESTCHQGSATDKIIVVSVLTAVAVVGLSSIFVIYR